MQNATPNTSYAKYEVKDGNGNLVTVTGNFEQVIIRIASFAAYIPNAEAPAVALAILTAAGWPETDRASITHQILGDLGRVVEITGQAAAKAELTRRRDELANEFTAVSTYNGQLPYVKNMLDRIIQLQDEATK